MANSPNDSLGKLLEIASFWGVQFHLSWGADCIYNSLGVYRAVKWTLLTRIKKKQAAKLVFWNLLSIWGHWHCHSPRLGIFIVANFLLMLGPPLQEVKPGLNVWITFAVGLQEGKVWQESDIKQEIWIEKRLHPRKLTWNLEMMVSNRNLLFQGSIFRFHVCFGGCKFNHLTFGWRAKQNRKKPCDSACNMTPWAPKTWCFAMTAGDPKLKPGLSPPICGPSILLGFWAGYSSRSASSLAQYP